VKLTCGANSLIEEVNDFGLVNFSGFDRSEKANTAEICQNIINPTFSSKLFDILSEDPVEMAEKAEYEQKVADQMDYKSHLINPYNIDNSCNFNTLFVAEEIKTEIRTFFRENCLGKSSCLIMPEMLSTMISFFTCDCRNRIGR
jgi:hypothetical protein